MDQEMKDLLYLIYDELKDFKLRVTSLESSVLDLRKDLNQQIAVTADLQRQISETRDELQQQITSVRDELQKQIADTRKELNEGLQQQITSTHNELQKQIMDTRKELNGELQLITARGRGLQKQISALKREVKVLKKQEQRNFEVLEQDLGGALDGMQILNKMKVDKKALRQATM